MIWYEDPIKFLTNKDNWFSIIPDSDMSLESQLNSLVMFSIYFAIIILIVRNDTRVLYIVAFTCLLTWMFHRHKVSENFAENALYDKMNIHKDNISEKYCVKPTKNNPFMNVTLNDYVEFPNRPPACKDNKDEVDKLYKEGAPVDDTDVFGVKGGDRQFFTNPSTTIPNDVNSFRDFLFDLKPTLKQRGQNF